MQTNQFLSQKSNYRNLAIYQKTGCIYDTTFYFAHRFLAKNGKTVNQMVQAARLGEQNMAEGYVASTTSSETEIKLLNVAKVSLQELLMDYQDYLRVRELTVWDVNSVRTMQTRRIHARHNDSAYYRSAIKERSDEIIADVIITLIHQTDIFLREYVNRMKDDFVKQGGIRE